MTDTTQGQDVTAGELPDAHELFPDKLPDADELYPDKTPYGQMRQHVSPIQDMLFSNPGRSHARILDAFGYGFKQNWGAGSQEFSEADEALKKAGIYNDYAKGQHSIIKAANEAVMRPAVAALIAGKSALSGVFAGGQAAVAQAGAEVGAPNVGREIAAIPEAFPAGFHQAMGIPHAPLPALIEQAKSLDVIGAGEEGYFGTKPDVAEPATAEVAKPAGVSAKEWNETILGQKPEGEAPSPVVQATPEAAPTEAAAVPSEAAAQAPEAAAAATAPDIHAVARQIAPETFHEFDALAQKKDTFRRWIGELREVRDEAARQNAPHADEIADLEERLKDATPRLAKKYQAKLDPLIAERDAYVADKTQGDSADMAKIRQQLMQADYRMRDLAADVSKAYRDAEARMPQAVAAETVAAEAPAAAVVAPVPAPETVIEGTNKASEVAGKQAVAPAEPTQAESDTVTTSPSDVTPKLPIAHAPSIVADVSQKLKAAGRPAEEADAAAQIVASYWETRAQRFEGAKGTAAEMYAAEAPDIKAGKENKKERALELAQRGKLLTQTRLVDPKTLVFRETEQNRLAEVREAFPEGEEYYPVVTILDGKHETILDGHNRAQVAIERGDKLPVVSITQAEYDALRAAKYDDIEIAYAALERAGQDEAASGLNRQFPGASVAERGTKAGGLLNEEAATDGDRLTGKSADNSDNSVVSIHAPEGDQKPNIKRTLEQSQRGRIRLREDGRSTITLMKNADASTFIHETGHEWLERMLDDARDKEAPEALRKDADTVLKWLGVDSADGVKTRHHEKFARGFETYMMEGRAPSSVLARVFAKFKNWLTLIYRTAASLKAPISDDIRGVFDRLLTEKPEKTVIAPERETKGGLGPRHEPLVESTPPEKAHEVANTIETERDSQIDRNLLETKDNDTRLADTGTEAEGRAARSAQPPGDADAAGPVGSEAGTPGGSGEVGGRGSEAAAEGAQPRQKSERLNTAPTPLLRFLASKGGIKASDELIKDLRQSLGASNRLIPGFGQLIRQSKQLSSAARKAGRSEAMSIDRAREAAIEAGHLPEGASITDFLDAIDNEVRGIGHAIDRPHDPAELAHAQHNFLEGLDDVVKQGGGVELSEKERARALELWHHEGLNDPAAIIERLALEADDRQIEGGAPERIEGVPGWDVAAPGWDVFDERPAASGAGESAAPARAGQPGGGAARTGGETQEQEPNRLDPNALLSRAETRLTDKAGNIRIENLNTPEDVSEVIRQTARDNGDFMGVRGPVPDHEVLGLADAMGIDAAYLDTRKLGEAWTAPQIVALRKLLVQTATAVRDAALKAAEGSEVEIVAYAEAVQRHRMVQERVSSVTAEAGRALRAFQSKFTEGMAEAKQISAIVEDTTGKTLYQLQQEAKFAAKLQTPQQVSKLVHDTASGKLKGAILEYYINALISGPVTHMRYSVGNAVNALWTPLVEVPLAATIGKIKEIATGEDIDRVHFGEGMAQLYGLMKGSRDGFGAAIEAFSTGVSPALPSERVSPHFAQPNRAVPGAIGEALNVPSKSVAAIHSFFKSLRYEQNIAGLAYRTAANEGLRGDAFHGRIAELTRSPTEAMMQSATADALKELFMAPTDYHSAMGSLTRAINSNLLAKIIVPFMKIGSQITRNAFIERTPIGLLDKDVRGKLAGGGADQSMQAAKMTAGIALMGGTVLMAAEGLATGDGPEDPAQRAIWLLNHRPNSIQIGDITLPYQGLGHLGMLMRFSADMYETAHGWNGEDGTKLAVSFLQGLTKSVLDENFMRGLKDMLDAVYHPQEYGSNYIKGFVTNWLPFSVGLSQVAHQIDPYQREAHSIFQAAQAKIPWLSEQLMPKRDRFGEPIPNGAPLPAYQNDPVVQAMESLHIGIGKLERKIRGVELSDEQFDDYARLAGRMSKMRLNALINTPGFALMPQQVKIDTIHTTISSSRESARSMILMQNTGIIQQATDAKLKKLRGEPAVH